MRLALLAAAVSMLVGCGRSSSSPPTFELRDLSVSRSASEIGTEIHGSASLVSNDQQLKGRTVVVLLQWKASDNDDKNMESVIVKDGTGLVKIFDYKTNANAPVPSYSNWEIVGYYDLAPATLTVK